MYVILRRTVSGLMVDKKGTGPQKARTPLRYYLLDLVSCVIVALITTRLVIFIIDQMSSEVVRFPRFFDLGF